MTSADPKENLKKYLQRGREALLWKLDGLDEYEIRRPMTPTATNLLGVVKHVALVESGYLGATFGRPMDTPLSGWGEDAELNADMLATADESKELITGFYRRVWAHSDETIDSLDLDATGTVPWWPAGNSPTLHLILVHMIAENERHAGHADIVRELIDGATGVRPDNSNLASDDPAWLRAFHDKVQQTAEQFPHEK